MDNINDLIGDAAKQLMAQADGIQNQKLKASAQRVAQTISAKTRDELVSQLGKRRWRVMGDPEDGWWVEVDSDGNELPGDWEYDRKGGYVYCAFA